MAQRWWSVQRPGSFAVSSAMLTPITHLPEQSLIAGH